MDQEIQQGNVLYVEELGKKCVRFVCEHCEKIIYKPIMYIRDPNALLLEIKDNLVLDLFHECGGLVNHTLVLFKTGE